MVIDLEIKNYRCFSRENPLKLRLDKGFTSFLGTNNSGKSSILKFFIELRQLFRQLGSPHSSSLNTTLRGRDSLAVAHVYDPTEIFNNFNNGPIEIKLSVELPEDEQSFDGVAYGDVMKLTLHRDQLQWSAEVGHQQSGMIRTQGRAIAVDGNGVLICDGTRELNLNKLCEAAQLLASSLYIGPFRNVINVGTNEDYFDIQVGEAFIKSWRSYKTGPNKTQQRQIQKLEDEIKRVFNFQSLTINASDDNKTLQVSIDGEPYKLNEVGSGIAQFILVYANALIKSPTFLLIDEPELGLHPSLQLDFLTSLASYATEGVLFATHSVGLARAASDKQYSVTVKGNNRTVALYEKTENLVELLGEMNFSGYRELGYDKVLMVEGVTEVKTLQQFLKHFGLNHKIVLLPLGGASMINGSVSHELEEMTHLSDKVYALIDSEKTSEADEISDDRKAFVDTCEKLGIECHTLERRATENYLTDAAIKAVKGDKYSGLGSFDKLETANPGWGKSENWLIAMNMSKDDLLKTDLGKFLEKVAAG